MKLKMISENIGKTDDKLLADLYNEIEHLPIHHQMARLCELDKQVPGIAKEIVDYEERTRIQRMLAQFQRDFGRVEGRKFIKIGSPERAKDASNRAKLISKEFQRLNMHDKATEWLERSKDFATY